MLKLNELKAEIVRNEMTIEEFADATNIDRTTMWRRFKDTNTFTFAEINRMIKVLNLSKTRIIEIFFTNEVA